VENSPSCLSSPSAHFSRSSHVFPWPFIPCLNKKISLTPYACQHWRPLKNNVYQSLLKALQHSKQYSAPLQKVLHQAVKLKMQSRHKFCHCQQLDDNFKAHIRVKSATANTHNPPSSYLRPIQQKLPSIYNYIKNILETNIVRRQATTYSNPLHKNMRGSGPGIN
jgi:hypothetical protein